MATLPFRFSRFSVAFVLCVISSSLRAAPQAEPVERPPIVLGQGEQRLLNLKGLERFSIGSDVVRVIPVPKQFGSRETSKDTLLIKGIQPGLADLWVWKKDASPEHRTVQVEKVPTEEVSQTIKRSISQLNEVEVIYSGTGVVLRGEIKSLAEASRIAALKRWQSKWIIDETECSQELLEAAEKRIQNWIQNSDFKKSLKVDSQASELRVQGNLANASDREMVEKRLKILFPLVRVDLLSLPDDSPTVHFKVFLLELRRDRFMSFGLAWPGSQELHVGSTGIDETIGLDLTLKALQGEGAAKLLSNPELVVRAPGEALLFSGGELPIRTKTHYFESVFWKSYGLTLQLKVTDSTSEKVRLEISTEVSRLDPANAPDEIPGIQTNRMKTQVDAHYGTPLLLSGLLQEGTRRQAQGLPLLRNIPVLGKLFGSEDYLNEKSELVAILLPSSNLPSSPMSRLRFSPRGPAPTPRTWLSPRAQREILASPNYPWNALQ